MDHALVQHLTAPRLLLLFALNGCIGAKGNDRHDTPPPQRTTAYVSPTGADTGAGDQATPFKTLGKALAGAFDEIVLQPGAYDEEGIAIDRPVMIASEGTAVLRGHVAVTGSGVTLRHLSLGGGLSANFADKLVIESSTVAPGDKDDTVELIRSSASFTRCKLACGLASCLQATTATVSIEDSAALGSGETKRIFRFDLSRGRIARTRFENSAIAHLMIGGSSQLELENVRLDGGNVGVVVSQGSMLIAKNLRVVGAAKSALTAQRAKLHIEGSTFGATRDQTIGLSGADASFEGSTIEGSPKGALSVIDHLVSQSKVRIAGGEIKHGRAAGILVASGEVTIAGVRFLGDNASGGGENDAITANGVDARVVVESAQFEKPGGFAVAFHSDASGTVTATVTSPRLGGVLALDVAADMVRVDRSVVKGCLEGSGVVAQEGSKVTVDRTRIEGCKEAGVLGGDKASVTVSRSSISNSGMYGCAAFGGSSIDVSKTRIRGSKVATFASCGDGARVEDRGENRFEGSVSACP